MVGNNYLEFQHKLTAANSASVVPNLTQYIRHDNKYNRVRAIEVGTDIIYFDHQYSGLIPVSYSRQPIKSIGREKSRHEVHFGMLHFNDGSRTDVAVKDGTMSLSLGEVAMMQYYQSRGQRTFLPLCVLIDQLPTPAVNDRLSHLITVYEGDINTLDSLNWPTLDLDTVKFNLRQAAVALAGLHENAIAHGDYEIKNIAQDEFGATFPIDLEHSTSFNDIALIAVNGLRFRAEQTAIASRLIEQTTRKDFRDLLNSINWILEPKNIKGAKLFKFIKENVLEIYQRALNPNGPYYKLLIDVSNKTKSVFKQEI